MPPPPQSMPPPPRGVILYGTEEPPGECRVLPAGPPRVELQNGGIRQASYHGIEVLRGVSFLIRDPNWATYGPEITNLKVEESGDGFRVTYDGQCADADQRFRSRAEITGAADGALSFAVTGQAETDFETNRLGFVVLHPIAGLAGEPVQVVHTDGGIENTRFPRHVSPDQPIYDIRSLTHEPLPGVKAVCTMEGDAFEMEDQRNWTDASYKTYIRPLSRPRPYTVPAGEGIGQTVSLRFDGTPSSTTGETADGPLQVTLGGPTGGRMPRIGLGVSADQVDAALDASGAIAGLGPQILVCAYDARSDGEEVLRSYRALAEAVGAEAVLELILPTDVRPDDAAAVAAKACASAGLYPAAVSVFPAPYLTSYQPEGPWPDVPPFAAYYAAARAAFPDVPIGGGMFCYFTELNRARSGKSDGLDYVTHTTCPIVHDADDRAVMESLEALQPIIESTKAFAGNVPYRIGPSAIGMRQNPYGAAPLENPGNVRLAMARADPRQRGLFGAAWNLGYVAEAARGGLDAVALSAPVGPFGVVYRKMDFTQPYYDGLEEARLFPVYHVLAGMARGAGREMLEATSSNRSRVQCVAWQADRGPELWLANLTAEPRVIAFGGLENKPVLVQTLDAARFAAAASNPALLQDGAGAAELPAELTLDTYAVARISSAP